jgi:hypothetical protein
MYAQSLPSCLRSMHHGINPCCRGTIIIGWQQIATI